MVGHGEDAAAIGQQDKGRIDDGVGHLGPRVAHSGDHNSFPFPTQPCKCRILSDKGVYARNFCFCGVFALAMAAEPI